jgi:hypothetical protein
MTDSYDLDLVQLNSSLPLPLISLAPVPATLRSPLAPAPALLCL